MSTKAIVFQEVLSIVHSYPQTKFDCKFCAQKSFFSSFNGKSSHFKFTSLRKLILPETAGNKESLEKKLKPHAGKKRPGSCKK